MWAFNEWKRCGLLAPKWRVVSLSAQQAGPAAARVIACLDLQGEGAFRVAHTAAYTVFGDGSVAVDNSVVPQGKRIPFARLGVRLLLDPKLDQFTYFGRGPMENYADRKRGSDVGLFASTVRQNMTPYAKPMECGNHEDVRWAALTGRRTPGLMAQAEDGGVLQVSALPYTDEQMDPVEYTVDLPPSEASVLVLAARTTGVGSNGCGPRPADEYVVWAAPATFSYTLRLLPPGAKLPALGRLQAPASRVKPVLAARDFGGTVSLSCETAGAAIEYALVGGLAVEHRQHVAAPDAPQVAVRASAAGLAGFDGVLPLGKLDRRARWKATASSFERGEGEPGNAFDAQGSTFWHSRWSKDAPAHPHWLAVDLGEALALAAVTVLPRQDGNSNGRIKDFEVYVSADGKEWGKPVAAGALKNSGGEQTIRLAAPARARHLKLVALSECSGQPFASVGELDVQVAK
jgi:beta-galactosidase